MIALALAALLYTGPTPAPSFTPGPDDPVCEPGQSVQVDHCAQGQLPGETAGREYDPAPAVTISPAAVPPASAAVPVAPRRVTVRVLAETGVPVAPYAAAAAAMIATGAGLLVARRRAAREDA